jgi:hypothetical protein
MYLLDPIVLLLTLAAAWVIFKIVQILNELQDNEDKFE